MILIPTLEYVAVISAIKKKILGPELFARNINKIFAMTSPWKKESERRQVTQN